MVSNYLFLCPGFGGLVIEGRLLTTVTTLYGMGMHGMLRTSP